MGGLSASAAFREHLRRLGLGEFPCGVGSWNKSSFALSKKTTRQNAARRDAGADQHEEIRAPSEESLETLMEFVSSPDSLWALPPDCSPEDQRLRELAVRSPQLIQDSFIFSFFKSLRLVDKGIIEVDENVLKFHKLEELILSANRISKINSAHLPRTLKVLELCGNEIVGLQDLCSHPPPVLQHLGLGYNRLLSSTEDKYLTAEFWPNLLSLDLSFNNFTDLLSIVSKVATLRQLRTLVLQGNPLVLIPGYRGFITDSLPKLFILDDRNISPDEKHQFHGLSNKPDLIVNEAQMVVCVGKLKGIPNPIKQEELQSSPESPVITHSYYVTYEFMEEKAENPDNAEVMKLLQSQAMTAPNLERSPWGAEEGGSESPVVSSLLKQEPLANKGTTESRTSDLELVFTSLPSWNVIKRVAINTSPVLGFYRLLHSDLCCIPNDGTVDAPFFCYRSFSHGLAPVNRHLTPRKPWAETIECSHRQEHVAEDLVALKAFLMSGTTVTVVEETVLSWPIATAVAEDAGKKGKAERGKVEKGKAEKGKQKDGGKGDKQKKKKESPIELCSDPPLLRTLGSGHVNLESLLTGDQLVAVVCDFGVLLTEDMTQPPSPKEKDGKKSKDKNKKTKTGGESPTSQKTMVTAKGKGKNKESPEMKEIQEIQPVPLTVEFQVQLIQWTDASTVQQQ